MAKEFAERVKLLKKLEELIYISNDTEKTKFLGLLKKYHIAASNYLEKSINDNFLLSGQEKQQLVTLKKDLLEKKLSLDQFIHDHEDLLANPRTKQLVQDIIEINKKIEERIDPATAKGSQTEATPVGVAVHESKEQESLFLLLFLKNFESRVKLLDDIQIKLNSFFAPGATRNKISDVKITALRLANQYHVAANNYLEASISEDSLDTKQRKLKELREAKLALDQYIDKNIILYKKATGSLSFTESLVNQVIQINQRIQMKADADYAQLLSQRAVDLNEAKAAQVPATATTPAAPVIGFFKDTSAQVRETKLLTKINKLLDDLQLPPKAQYESDEEDDDLLPPSPGNPFKNTKKNEAQRLLLNLAKDVITDKTDTKLERLIDLQGQYSDAYVHLGISETKWLIKQVIKHVQDSSSTKLLSSDTANPKF